MRCIGYIFIKFAVLVAEAHGNLGTVKDAWIAVDTGSKMLSDP